MRPPDTCPHCGSVRDQTRDNEIRFVCGTLQVRDRVYRAPTCGNPDVIDLIGSRPVERIHPPSLGGIF